jgi:ribose/xylose/arabinose/galactoside ABC-type transport system permease subunit
MGGEKLKKMISSEASIILILLLLCVIVTLRTPTFATANNILNVLKRTASTGIVAVGMTFAIATGGIDLSVGGQVTLMGILAATFFKTGMPTVFVMMAILGMSVGFGAFNGVFVSIFKFPAFMVTLALQLITNGFSLYITSGRSIVIDREGFDFWGLGNIGGIPVPIWLFLAVSIVGLVLLRNFTIGRRILAVGSNDKGAWYAGISVTRTIIAAYIISGVTAGVSTIILASKLMNASPSLGSNLELDAIAAVVIGGTSLSGGNGYIIGTVAGALIIEVIGNWLTLQSINPFLREVVKGTIILLALLLDNIRRGKLTQNEFAS